MKNIKIVSVFVLLLSIKLCAQFSVANFLDQPFDKNITTVKQQLGKKHFEEKVIMNMKGITFFEWSDRLSLKVGYMFTNDGLQIGKVLSNGKETDKDAKKAFDVFKKELAKKFGPDYSEINLMGIQMLQWKGIEHYKVMLTRKDKKTMLTIIFN